MPFLYIVFSKLYFLSVTLTFFLSMASKTKRNLENGLLNFFSFCFIFHGKNNERNSIKKRDINVSADIKATD